MKKKEEKNNRKGKGGKYLEKENVWSRKIFVLRGKVKGGKYLEKENI